LPAIFATPAHSLSGIEQSGKEAPKGKVEAKGKTDDKLKADAKAKTK
jgi:hypothetical protein